MEMWGVWAGISDQVGSVGITLEGGLERVYPDPSGQF